MQKSFKKTLALILSIVMIIGVLPMGLSFAAETEGDFTYEIEDGKAVVIGYNGPAAVVVPETLGGKPVVKLGNDPVRGVPFFHSNTDITSVVLPDTVEEIVPGSFYGCTNLETIDLGGATKIGNTVFGGCSKLTTITMDADVTTIEVNAFATDTIKNVNFEGTIAQWNAILASMASGNSVLESATVVYCYGKDCEHNYKVVSDTATCLEDGTKKSVCTDCGYELVEVSYAKWHSVDEDSIEDSAFVNSTVPTCTTGGVATVNCDVCNEEFTLWVPALGHKVAEADWNILTEATCTGEGTRFGQCEVCEKWTSEVISAKGHTDKDVIPGKEPTCTDAGYTESRYCTTCETFTVVAETISALGHDYFKDVDSSSEPTCTVAGLYLNICGRCGDRKYEAVNNLGHDIVNVDAQAPDCENFGWNAYKYCTRCEYTTYVKLPAKGHTAGAAATCLTAQTCVRCEYVYQEALGHDVKIVSGKDVTCTANGLTDGEYCDRCKVVLKEQSAIIATGHKTETVKGTPATCTENGLKDGIYCNVCNTWVVEQEVITAPGHKKVKIPAVPQTCTEYGWTEGEGCENCDYFEDEPQRIDPYGSHDIITVYGYPATCTEKGLTDGKKCSRSNCDYVEVEQEEIPAAHKLLHIKPIAPTCTEAGYTFGQKCTVCEVFTIQPEELPATGHTEGPAATCAAAQTCTVCNAVLAAALAHTPGVAATCTDPQVCTVCNGVLAEALGHDLVFDTAVSCHLDGYEKASCKRCDYSYTKTIPATGHNVETWTVVQSSTCKEEGKAVGVCMNCKHTMEDKVPVVDHKDELGNDNKCDFCGKSMGGITLPDFGGNDKEDEGKCSCNCHAVGIKGLIFDFILFLQRLFGFNRVCKCGEPHYD